MDCNPSGIQILSGYRYGFINSAYDVIDSVTPNIRWLGVGPQDAMKYNVPGNMLLPMTERDINMAMTLLEKEYVKENVEWVEALKMMLQKGEKFEIEALSTEKIDYLTRNYLPSKLKELLAKLEDGNKKRLDKSKEDAAAQTVDEPMDEPMDEPKEYAADQISRPGTETIPLPQLVSSTLYVEGIPSDWTIRKVADIFCGFLGYKKVRLEVTKESMAQVGDPSVVGFVDFADPFCASAAMSSVLEGPGSSLRLRFSPS